MSQRDRRRRRLGLLLGLIGVASFSLTLPMTRLAVSSIDAGTVAVWRGLLAALAAGVILLFFFRQWPERRQIIPLFITGVGIVFGFPVLTTLAMQTIPSSHGAIVVGLLPISTAVVGVLATNERPSMIFWLISALGTVFILVFIFRQSDGRFELGHIYLICAVLFAAVGYAFGGTVAKNMGAARVICWALVLMLPGLLVAAFFVPPVPWKGEVTPLLAFLYLAFVSQLMGFFAWYAGLAMGGITRVSQVQLLQLFMTLIASALILSEPLDAEVWLFAALVVLSVAISSRLRINTTTKKTLVN